MATSTSLGLQAVLKSAVVRAGLDGTARVLAGLSPAAKALAVAAAAHQMPRGTVVLVTPTDRDLEQLVSDVTFFLAALEGLSAADADRAVLPLPSYEVDPYRGLTPHFGVLCARARAFHALARRSARVVVVSAAALRPRVSTPDRLLRASIELRPGQDIAPNHLAVLLVDAGFRREDPADEHGEFALRGGILDVYPPAEPYPIRLEFIGDTIETLRTYDPATQRSNAPIDQVAILPLRDVLPRESDAEPDSEVLDPSALDRDATVFDYVARARSLRLLISERDEVEAAATKHAEQVAWGFDEAPARVGGAPAPEVLFLDWHTIAERLKPGTELAQLSLEEAGATGVHHVRCQPTVELNGRVPDWVSEIKKLREAGETTIFVAASAGRAERTIELLKEYDVYAVPVERADDARYAAVLVALGHLSRGFRLPDAALQLYAESDVFEEDRHAPERRRSATKAFLSDLRDLKVGDLIVHADHGIGVFVGLKQIGVGEATQEFLELHYAAEDKLFVPVERLDLIQKFTGAAKPPLDRLGGTSWERAKTKVKKAMRHMAEELLKLYAARRAVAGHAFSADSHWQQEFEDAFEYELTPDQKTAIADIKRDMESSTPMDRLLCGDVGYGKTEVAMRAAFKAVMDSKQVAFLAPTTVLAFQHQKTLKERFAGFPVRIDMVSRFRTKAEQKETLDDLAAGKVDVIVGTHRLLSKDVQFRDLGLLVVDEEQRFGVAHKERIKQLRRKVDVLTMTATPIPRTLNMSLVGIRDMSIIETPPKDRLSIQTNVVKFDQEIIRRAIRTELERGGQVYLVHNRVESILSIANLVQRLVPEARLVIGHGQMDEDSLERAMLDFVARKFEVLVATTIVENGLDIPNANTIIINRADRYGLSQLYQLRGRVGRSDRPAYAYLLIPPEDNLSPVAKKRLAAIREFSDLGSGFRVAALDLEIRGAGNLLGGEQSGHIEAVGFEMYMKLLEDTVRELKGEPLEDDVRATVNLGADLRIDESYIPDMNQRLMLYRKVASARGEDEIDKVLAEATDRYGPPPDSVRNLADYGCIRVMADALGVESIDREGRAVVLTFRPQAKVDPALLVNLVRQRPELTLVPPAALKVTLDAAPTTASARPQRSGPAPVGARPAAQTSRAGKPGKAPSTPSWWTARARTGEVTPGFTKEEILRPVKDDPRRSGGVFDRVGGLLRDLLGRSGRLGKTARRERNGPGAQRSE
ncbi:MAG: transcription-repair coupling factor [Acidimicrobiia bacterium]|nr:transcription-repair coupling factor [Acidimicrobiia bacterium]